MPDATHPMSPDDPLAGLREAVRLSPENLPLRRHLAEQYLATGRPADAETEVRNAMEFGPDDLSLKYLLATAFDRQGKASHAVVLLEDLVKSPAAPPRARLLFARLVATSDRDAAARQYRQGVKADPSLADAALAEVLGADDEDDDEDDESEEIDGRRRAPAAWQPFDDDEDAAPADDSAADPSAPIERPKLAFADVGGLDGLKEEIRLKIIHPLKHPDLYRAYGKKTGGGILMYGPPGCGKTYLARATAGETQSRFISIGISDVLDMWIGNSEKRLAELFTQARRNKPCVLFFDEVDALAASRADMRTSGGRHLINQFLAEMDGVDADNDGVLILAATNAPWHVDPAFRRPGRFDRVLFVPPPDGPARAAILRAHVKGKPVGEIDFDKLAAKTDGFSGADLKAVVDAAVEAKLTEAIKSGVPQPLTTKDLLRAAGVVKPSTREWFSTARNHALYANQGGAYDDVLKYLKM